MTLIIKIWFLLIINVTLNYSQEDTKNPPIVKIDDGLIRGQINETVGLNKTYYAFRGIPYAQPPLGELRFEPPKENSKWSEILDATEDKPQCIQISDDADEGSEDCLYINVYTTSLSNKSMPVMVWIYGGFFLLGNSSYTLYGPDYLLEQDVVYVSFNYRLNIFGFISTGDLSAPGNNGLKDQIHALKWVQKNIANFGGDPNSVTVFGQSAGGASISYLQLSPLSKGLFHRAILESGSALCPWTFTRNPKENAENVGKKLKADLTSSRTLIESLKKINASVLFDAAFKEIKRSAVSDPLNGFPFTPVIEPHHDGAFLTKKAHRSISKGEFYNVPVIIGYTSNEAASFNLTNRKFSGLLPLYLTGYDLNYNKLIPDDMNVDNPITLVGSKIKTHYFGWFLPISFKISYHNLLRYVSDDQFVRPIREQVWQQSKYSQVYFYRFSYEGNLTPTVERKNKGAGHGEDTYYIFRSIFKQKGTPNDTLVRERMVKLWTNFAKTGNPTPQEDSVLQNTIWSDTRRLDNHLLYLDIGEDLEVGLNPDNKNVKFWNDLYKNNGNPLCDTY